ncbi:MAG: DUF4062 domain-containing protein [Methanospirillaceae archaeon]|nr:DUF4062 domain-containing protein [Methanospirillaceae archaeon]
MKIICATASIDLIKNSLSSKKTEYPSPSADPCKDDTFSPRFAEKKINVFVSSTFRDMVAERDELTLNIFPAIRKECELRNIPPDKSETGETLNICLQYIDRCRTYFIGMLGERYGWVDPDTPRRVIDDFP